MTSTSDVVVAAIAPVEKFIGADGLTVRIGALECGMQGADRDSACRQLREQGVER
jgi:hypothetical protein